MPEGFERATGVAEAVRQCMEPGCRKYFRAANEHDVKCPHCESTKTRSIKASASLGGVPTKGNISVR
jgi:Zn finger protein HypA/HybF involved in hydrogenase expression